ncbi:MAG: hypothetical protein ACI32O_01345 [Enterococcus sp.]
MKRNNLSNREDLLIALMKITVITNIVGNIFQSLREGYSFLVVNILFATCLLYVIRLPRKKSKEEKIFIIVSFGLSIYASYLIIISLFQHIM